MIFPLPAVAAFQFGVNGIQDIPFIDAPHWTDHQIDRTVTSNAVNDHFWRDYFQLTGVEISGTDCADVDVQPVQDQLHADEREDQREPRREVDQPVQQALDQEEQRPQAEQGERVRREDDVGLLRDTEDRGDRVEGEQQVDAADRDEHDEQRGDHPAGRRRG